MSRHVTDETAQYGSAAADMYVAFRAMPNSTSADDDYNAMQGVQQAVGRRTGVRVVDLGCGPGLRTRAFAELWGVSAAIGIDHSRQQLDLARAEPIPGNCRFEFGDLVALGAGPIKATSKEPSRSATSATPAAHPARFVTSHAATQAELDAMLRGAAAFLRPGGRLVIVDAHPRVDTTPLPPCDGSDCADPLGLTRHFSGLASAPGGHPGVRPRWATRTSGPAARRSTA